MRKHYFSSTLTLLHHFSGTLLRRIIFLVHYHVVPFFGYTAIATIFSRSLSHRFWYTIILYRFSGTPSSCIIYFLVRCHAVPFSRILKYCTIFLVRSHDVPISGTLSLFIIYFVTPVCV